MTGEGTARRSPSTPSRPPVRRTGRSGVFLWVFVGLIVVGAGAAWPTLQPILAQFHLGKLAAGLDGPGGMVNAPAAAGDQASYQPISRADRLDATVMTLSMRLDMVERRLAAAEEKLHGGTGGGAGVDTQKMAQDVQSLRQEIDGIEHVAANVRHLTDQKDRSPLFLLAIGHLREAVDRGAPYIAELQSSAAVLGAAAVAGAAADPNTVQRLAVVQPFAQQGVETRISLALRFPDVAEQALRSLAVADSSPLMGRALRWLSSFISVRRAEGPGDALSGTAPTAILRAKHLLAAGDLNAAMVTLQPVAGQGGDALDAWMTAAAARVAVDAALSELSAAALAKTAIGE